VSIFNSLGSNYSLKQVWESLYVSSTPASADSFAFELGDHYGGKAQLTYKGRQALEIALKRLELPEGSQVAINGFTCYVVYQAVRNAGYEPVMVDVAPGRLDYGVQQLGMVHEKAPSLRAIIVQNTLGLPVEIAALRKYCDQHKLLLVEDLAHSLGTTYADGSEAGTVGDLTMLSFSQDKPLDVVAGGACIDRRKQAAGYKELPVMSMRQSCINRLYPSWTLLIRTMYSIGLGRVLHLILKKLHWLATPMSDNVQGLYTMTPMSSGLAPDLWNERRALLDHRRRIAEVYQRTLPQAVQYESAAGTPAYLRFPVRVPDRAGLVAYLKHNHIYIGDTWYDAPIAPKRYLAQTNYQPGQCPRAEQLATEIVNLPTHRNVGEAQAQYIAERVNQWLTST
jgi:dTDP-4-amino-4,6-dideoxygalactose transaminase